MEKDGVMRKKRGSWGWGGEEDKDEKEAKKEEKLQKNK